MHPQSSVFKTLSSCWVEKGGIGEGLWARRRNHGVYGEGGTPAWWWADGGGEAQGVVGTVVRSAGGHASAPCTCPQLQDTEPREAPF